MTDDPSCEWFSLDAANSRYRSVGRLIREDARLGGNVRAQVASVENVRVVWRRATSADCSLPLLQAIGEVGAEVAPMWPTSAGFANGNREKEPSGSYETNPKKRSKKPRCAVHDA